MRLWGHTVSDGKLVFQTNLLRSIEITIGDVWKRCQVRRLSDIMLNIATQMKANHNVLKREKDSKKYTDEKIDWSIPNHLLPHTYGQNVNLTMTDVCNSNLKQDKVMLALL